MIFLALLLVSSAAFAGSEPGATVWVRDPAAVRHLFPADKYLMIDAEHENRELRESGYIGPHQRTAVFYKLKIEDALKALDDMDKDRLIYAVQEADVSELIKRYPMLNKKQLKALQNEVKELLQQ